MPVNIDTFLNEVTTIVEATWADTVANGIWEFDESVRGSWERRTFPFAVWDLPGGQGGAEWGCANVIYEGRLELHRIARASETQATMRSKLILMQNAILAGSYTDMRVLDVAEINWSGSHPAMAVFHSKNIPFRGGSISFDIIFGQGYNE